MHNEPRAAELRNLFEVHLKDASENNAVPQWQQPVDPAQKGQRIKHSPRRQSLLNGYGAGSGSVRSALSINACLVQCTLKSL